MTEIIIGLVISMLLAAYFSGMEIAFVSADKLRLEVDNEHHGVIYSILNVFYHHSGDYISTMLVGNEIVLVLYGSYMSKILRTCLSPYISNDALMLIIQTIVSTLIILFIGEFMPKAIFKTDANKLLPAFAPPTYIFYVVLKPISKFCSACAKGILRIFGIKTTKENSDKAFGKVDLDYFLQTTIDTTKNKDELEPEVKIFRNALDFSTIKIRDCAIPRTEIIAIEMNTPTTDLMQKFTESGISKVVVYKENIDNIIGYIHSSEMFRNPDHWREHIQQMPIVPETMSANKLLKLFMNEKKSLAVVVDEFGGTSGIVALEDIVEEIFGDIQDEHDTNTYIAKKIDGTENKYILSARLEIEHVNEMFNIDLPESEDYQTVGGLILDYYQSFPKLHETITIRNFHFKILKVSATKIELVQLEVIE